MRPSSFPNRNFSASRRPIWFPVYIGSELFSESEKRAFLDDVIALYERTGKISGQDRILGYDFGMFLYALCETDIRCGMRYTTG